MDDVEARLRACVENDDLLGFTAIIEEYGMEQAGKFLGIIESHNISVEDLPKSLPEGWIRQSYYQDRMEDAEETALELWHLNFDFVLDTLGKDLLLPMLVELPVQIKKLILMPSSTLLLFPLHAAPLNLGARNLLRMCDFYEVSYVPSLEIMANCRARISTNAAPSLFAVINPEEDSELIYSQLEAAAVTELFDDSLIYEGHDGTVPAVLKGSRGRNYLHFCCHGERDWTEEVSSILRLADKPLVLDDLMTGNLDLTGARLVTLSACETGIANIITSSADEFRSLPAGFMLAGVPCVVSSLWPVPDLSTAILMEYFYSYHLKEKMPLPSALAEAQRSTREMTVGAVADYADKYYSSAEGETRARLLMDKNYYRHRATEEPELRPFAAPYHWAAFTVYGL